ncbi:MAG: alpha/beta fold hydrolase [Candidatus Hydrogenedentes bacterium]|nr:alpha/beta fold hydrolase [Candidatus Hydrogenedentota bacterium]
MATLLTFIFWVLVVLVLGSLLLNGYMIVLMLRYPKPQKASEVHTVKTADGWNIQLFRRKTSEAPGEPVLFVHGLAANRLNLEAPAGASLVDTLAAEGYDCWSIELRCCESAAPPESRDIGDISFDDYLYKDLPAAIAHIRETTGHDKVHWVGHSMGAMLLYAYNVVFKSEALASGISLGGPVRFKNISYTPPRILFRLTMVAPKFTRTILKAMVPCAWTLRPKLLGMPVNWDNLHPDVDAQTLFNVAEVVPPQVAHEFDDWLNTGSWKVKGGQVNVSTHLSDIDVPLLVICGRDDPFTPEPEMQQFLDALPGKDKQLLFLSRQDGASTDYGHVDLLFGLKSKSEVFAPALQWIQEHPVTGARRKTPRKRRRTQTVPASAKKKAPAKKKQGAKKPVAAKKAPVKKKAALPKKKPASKKKPAATKKKPAAKKKTRTKKKTATKKKSIK